MNTRQEEGGICGGCMAEAANNTYLMLYKLYHRGRSSGICCFDGQTSHGHRGYGPIQEVFPEGVLQKLTGNWAIGQVKFHKEEVPAPAALQPFSVQSRFGPLSAAFVGSIHNTETIRNELVTSGSILQTDSEAEMLLHLVHRSKARNLRAGIMEVLSGLEGAYALAILGTNEIFLARDPVGRRPLAYAYKPSERGTMEFCFASETCAFDILEARYIAEVPAGAVLHVTDSGKTEHRFAAARPEQQCMFEFVFLAMPDSNVFGKSVQMVREELGRKIARHLPSTNATIVIGFPDSGIAPAIALSETIKVPYKQALIRNHYNMPGGTPLAARLNAIQCNVEGQSVILVMNHAFRGGSATKAVKKLRKAGALHVHLVILQPQTKSSCQNGIDIPPPGELIANRMNCAQMAKFINADTITFLPLEDLDIPNVCTECYKPGLVQIS